MNWSGEGSVAENPNDRQDLVAVGVYDEPNAYNHTTTYLRNGTIGVALSSDGGRTWSVQNLPPSPAWSDPTSPECGQIHYFDPTVAFGSNDTVYVADLTHPVQGGGGVSCHNASKSIVSLYVTRSTDGGSTWDAPEALAGTNAAADLDKPWIAADPRSGFVYVAYVNNTVDFQASHDGGLNWTRPLHVGTSGAAGDPELVVDSWGALDLEWIDDNNASIEFSRSTDHGTTFSVPRVIAVATLGTAMLPASSSSPDAFRAAILPALAVDGFSGNTFTGRLVVVWQNGSGGTAGSPEILLITSSNNGSTWSRPVRVDTNSDLESFQPDAAVDPNGTVYVEWYGENATTGRYRLVGAISRDGGASFGTPFVVSLADSDPQYSQPAGNVGWIGDYTDLIADARGARPIWTDARSPLNWNCSSPCVSPAGFSGYDYNISLYTAEMTYANLSSNIPITLQSDGSAPAPGQLQITPSYEGWLVGENYSLTAPSTQATSNGTEYFALWYGSTISTDRTVQGAVTGSFELAACYVPSPGDGCHVAGAPGEIRGEVSPAGASVTVDGAPVATNSSTGAFEEWASDGGHTVAARLSGYEPSSLVVDVTPGNDSYANMTLAAPHGELVGRVVPATAQVALTPGSELSVSANGSFGATLAPGPYSVAASLQGFAPARENVTIATNRTSWVNLTLGSLFGWVNGTVVPSTANVTVDGSAVAVDPAGQFSAAGAPGPTWVNASAPGYLPESLGPLMLDPQGQLTPHLWLPLATGEVIGSVTPSNASMAINGTTIPTPNGTFDVRLNPGVYPFTSTAAGYLPASGVVEVTHNESVRLAIVLTIASGWLRSTVAPARATVTIDGTPVKVNTTGTFNVTLAAGSHAVVVAAPGYRTLRETVQIAAGSTLVVPLALAPVTSNPWSFALYLGAAAVGMGVAAAGVVWVRRTRGPAARTK